MAKILKDDKVLTVKADYAKKKENLFSGLVYGTDCANKLYFAICKSFNGLQDHYCCAKYRSNTGSCTAFICEEVLKQIAWSRIFGVTALFFDDIRAFHEMIYQQRFAEFDSFAEIIHKYAGIMELTPQLSMNLSRKS